MCVYVKFQIKLFNFTFSNIHFNDIALSRRHLVGAKSIARLAREKIEFATARAHLDAKISTSVAESREEISPGSF